MSVLLPAYANVETPYYVPATPHPVLNIFTISGATTTKMFDFASDRANFPVPCSVNFNFQDGSGPTNAGAGVLGQGVVFISASGSVPIFGSYSTAFSEAGVTAANVTLSGTSLYLNASGKTTSTSGSILLTPVADVRSI
jgi:hypothetical protein